MIEGRIAGLMTYFCNCHSNKKFCLTRISSLPGAPECLSRDAAYSVFTQLGAMFCYLILAAITGTSCAQARDAPRNLTESVQIPVMVRDATGRPVRGLTANDFVVGDQSERMPFEVLSSGPNSTSDFKTSILIVVAPMELSGRANAFHELSHSLTSIESSNYQVALLDSSGKYFTFTQNLQELKNAASTLASQPAQPQYRGGPWVPAFNRAIEELGLMPGRRAIVTFTDYESKGAEAYHRNPNLLRVDPMNFVSLALRARASIYSVQTSGPTPVVPFGSAASSEQYSGSGQSIAERINSETVFLGQMRSQLLQSSALTGGKTANDLKDAFLEIKSDIEGYYLISFKPNPLELDGEWHSLQITTRYPQLNVAAAHFYRAPLNQTNTSVLPSQIVTALKGADNTDALPIALNAWLFPNHRGAYSLTVSADIRPPTPSHSPNIQIYAQLRNETANVVTGSWAKTLQRSVHINGNDGNEVVRWQHTTTVFPGSYTLKVAALDDQSKALGSLTYHIMVHSFEHLTVPVSSLVIASGCLTNEKGDNERHLLQNPLQWNSCELAPSSQFVVGTPLQVLVRLYPRDAKFAAELTSRWSAQLIVDNVPLQASAKLPVVSEPDGTVTISSAIQTSSPIQNEGNHQAEVLLVGPKNERILLARSHFRLVGHPNL